MRSSHLVATILVTLAGGAGPTEAHAYLKTASPAPGSTVHTAPSSVSIDFTQQVQPQSSRIVVQDADYHPVSNGAVAAAGDGTRLSIGVNPLGPGTYRVIWHATAVDTHTTQGTYEFTVQP